MHLTAHLDLDLIALDSADDVTCLVQLTAPMPDEIASRPGQALVIVLDRSGSMAGEPLEASKRAIATLARRLAPQDVLGVVTFDNQGDVVVPATRMRDLNAGELDARIMGIRAGGSTDLSAGYLLGLREAGRATATLGSLGATVLVVSDGHVNAGIADPVILAGLAQKAQQDDSVTTSTVGFGLGYDEVLLEAVTRGGNGTHRFAPDVDAATREIADLVGDLLGKSVVGAMMRIRPQLGAVGGVSLRQDLPNWVEADAVVVNLGDLYGGEERKTLFRLHVPALQSLGTATVALIEFEYTSLPDLRHHTITLPVSVNVVPGDEARDRVPNPIVEVESLIADIDAEKKAIATSLRSGDSDTARRSLGTAIMSVNAKRADLRATSAEPSLTQRLDDVAAELLGLADDVLHRGAEYSSKSFTDSYSSSSRGRKGKGKPHVTPLTDTDGGGGSGPAA